MMVEGKNWCFWPYPRLTLAVTSFSYIITLANAIGVFLDVKMVNLVPKLVCMNKNFVYVSDGNIVYYWQYKDSSVKTGRKLNLEGICLKHFFILPTINEIRIKEEFRKGKVLCRR